MNAAGLALRSLAHRWRTNLAAALGAALAAAVLVGALGAGDSVRASLRRLALQHLGETAFALRGGERFFRAALADELAARLQLRGAALLLLRGAASAAGGQARAAPVQVLGVDAAFWGLAPDPASSPPQPGAQEVLLNEPLARRLRAAPGDEILLRVADPSAMPADAPLSTGASAAAVLRLTVKGVIAADAFGDFDLRQSQAPPLNAFLDRDLLAARLAPAAAANAVLLGPGRSLAEVEQAFAACFRLEDAGLSLRRQGPGWELRSQRVFLEPAVEAAALGAAAQNAGRSGSPGLDPGGLLTWFADRIACNGRSLPYSFVSSAGPARLGVELGAGEIALNSWAAGRLEAAPGDPVELEYRVPAAGGGLELRAERFRLVRVVPIQPGDRDFMPDFPGLAEVSNCRDWNPGFPLDLSRIGERDQRYWERYRGSPKAFLGLGEAQRLWASRFGRLTAFRFPAEPVGEQALATRLRERLDPASLGLRFQPVRELALKASAGSVDFGELFLGLSFFLVASALLLAGLLFQLSVEQRRADAGTLAALGFTPGRILRILMGEGALVALVGSAAGLPAGLAFHRAVLAGLGGAWQGAVRSPALVAFVSPASLAAGFLGGLAASLAVIAAAVLRLLRSAPARNLRGSRPAGEAWRAAVAGAAACALGAGAVLAAVHPPLSFFAAGALLLTGCLAAASALLARLGRPRTTGLPSIGSLGLASAARRRGRSLAVASLLACGIFVVAAVAANRRGVPDSREPRSGTGGFDFVVETASPLGLEGHSAQGPPALRLPPLEGASLLGFRLLEGEDASCLNLNRVRQPAVLAVDPARLRGRFSFASPGRRPPDPWELLNQDLGQHTIPAIADQTVITYGLGLEVGDELEYRDERGEVLRLRLVAGLANSIFQGRVLVAEEALLRHFPSTAAFRFFLVSAAPERRGDLARALDRALGRYGAAVSGTAERLAELNSVENTYLAIFAFLGWLGMLVGTLGLAAAAARNVAEMRPELALLRAVGWRRERLLRLVLAEHLPPIGLGLAGGAASAALAAYPASALRGGGLPAGPLLALAGSIAASAILSTVLAAALALRGKLLPALRGE